MRFLLGKLPVAALLVVMLPGLVLPRNEPLRVCLHDWFGFADACGDVALEASCCEKAPAELALSEGLECQGCCFEITNDVGEMPAPVHVEQVASACLLAPERLPPVMAWPALLQSVSYRGTLLVDPPGRAPNPLRI